MGCCVARGNGLPPAQVVHTIVNVGGFAEIYRNGTGPAPFEFRTIHSPDSSLTIAQAMNSVDFIVASPGVGVDVFQVNTTDTRTSNTATLTTFVTLTGTSKMLSGEEWKINMDVGVAVASGTSANAEQVWQVETSTGVFTEFDRYSLAQAVPVTGSEQAWPQHRTKNLVASMNAPRMRLQVRRTAAGSFTFFWENPGWGGFQIAEAP